MEVEMRTMLTIGCAAAVLLAANSASGQDLYDWPNSEVPAVVHDGGGLFFIGKDKTVWRVYKWRASSGDKKKAAFLTDIDGDSKADVVGAGKPTFALDHDSNPIWFHSGGCDQVLVSDFAADDKKDILCLNGKTLELRTWDWQMVWKISIGRRFDWCQAGDVNGDLKSDAECKQRGSKKYTRIDGSSGELLGADAETSEVANPDVPGIDPVDAKTILAGKKEFDLDGDGTAEESLLADGNAVAIRSRSKKSGLGRIEMSGKPTAALVKDLDGDKKPDVVVVSSKEIAIWSAGQKKPSKFPLSTSSYKRQPVANLQSVYANNFEDNAKAQKAVKDLNDKLANCYASQVRRNQFAGVGRTLLEVKVDKKGKVTDVAKHHSSVADKKVVSCAQNVLKKGDFPKATADSASVNVTLQYTFRDE
jgi:hypothetical protein